MNVWVEAFNWALESAEKDWMCFLSISQVLTRFKKFALAEQILQYQLNHCPYYEKYHRSVNLQLAFIHFSEQRHVMAIEYYMRGLHGKDSVSSTTHDYIKISMKNLSDNQKHCKYDKKFVEKARHWFSLLRPENKKN